MTAVSKPYNLHSFGIFGCDFQHQKEGAVFVVFFATFINKYIFVTPYEFSECSVLFS